MSTRMFIGLCLTFITSYSLAVGGGTQQNLIGNGGFENGLDQWQHQYGRVTVVTEAPQSGEKCLRINHSGAIITGLIDVKDTMVEITGWMRTQGVQRGRMPWNQAGFQLIRYDADKKPWGRNQGRSDFGQTVGDTDWKQYRITVIGKKGACYVRLQCHLWGCAAGVGYFDDIRIVRKPIPESYFKVRPRSEMESNAPIIWPQPPVEPGPNIVDNGVVRLSFGQATSPAVDLAANEKGKPRFRPALKGFRLSLTVGGQRLTRGDTLHVSGGYDVRRSHITRRAETWSPTQNDHRAARPNVVVRFFTEILWRSPRVYLYPRIVFNEPTKVDVVEAELLLPDDYTTACWFEGVELRSAALASRPRVALDKSTVKPFLTVFSTGSDANRGLVIFLPLPAEVRTWYMEDYVPVEHPIVVDIAPGVIRFTVAGFDAPAAGHHSSFDLYYTLMPYESKSDVQAILNGWPTATPLCGSKLPFSEKLTRGFWTKRIPTSGPIRPYLCSRYFPVECFSFCGSDRPAPTYDYWRPGGHAWGMLTSTFKSVNFSGFVSEGFHRDTAIRLGQFFIDRADELGEPHALTMVGDWARTMPDPQAIYRFHFAQYGEFTLRMFRHWLLEAKVGDAADRDFIWSRLNRLKALFDPAHPQSWTWRTPGGGYWFCYSNVFHKDPAPGFVINTHVTAAGNAGELMQIARGLGKDADYKWWRDTFRRGVDGLLWDLSLDDAWYVGAHDPNEVKYGRRSGGPSGYHGYMATAWLPHVIEIAIEDHNYRVAELLAIERRLLKADYMKRHPKMKQIAEDFLKRTESRGRRSGF